MRFPDARPLLFLLAAMLLLTNAVQAQPEDPQVKEIRSEVNSIRKLPKLRTKIYEGAVLEEPTDRGEELRGYFDAKDLRRIAFWAGVSNGNHVTNYYFRRDSLLFIYYRFEAAWKPGADTLNYSDTEVIAESRIYFKNGACIYSMESGSAGYRLKQRPEALKKEAETYRDLLRRQKN